MRLRGVVPPGNPAAEAVPSTIGRYRILKVLGRGAMGVVYKAQDPLLDRVVAIKTINAPSQLGDRVRRAFFERFVREAKAAAGISHPAVVTIFDVGLEIENPYLVMEYLPGQTLAERLDRGPMPLPAVIGCAGELASALGRAHRQRIVHRDVKPANVLSAGDGRWKLADFGIARLPDSDLTQLGTFMGTPGYSPPEAIREGRYTAQADVFAWGALFYELLCGQIPYEGPDTETTNKKVLLAEPPSPRISKPDVPEPLAEVAMRALAHDPKIRYADGAAVAQALGAAWRRTIASGAVSLASFAEPLESADIEPASRFSGPRPVVPATDVDTVPGEVELPSPGDKSRASRQLATERDEDIVRIVPEPSRAPRRESLLWVAVVVLALLVLVLLLRG